MNIGIIGAGMVGGTIEACFSSTHTLFVHDPRRGTELAEILPHVDCVYISVPTPSGPTGECDTSLVEQTLECLPTGMTAIIKSTVIPGTTQRFHDQYPNLKIAYSPEFLVERNRIEDFSNQDFLVVGTHHADVAQLVFEHHVQAGVMRNEQLFHVTPTEAELVKYTKNTFNALKVIFANQIYDLSQKLEADYQVIKKIITTNHPQKIGEQHLEPMFGANRGFGGKCLPKDTLALLKLAESLGVKYHLLDALQIDNEFLRKISTGLPSMIDTNDD